MSFSNDDLLRLKQEGKTYRQIAEFVNMPYSVVKDRILRRQNRLIINQAAVAGPSAFQSPMRREDAFEEFNIVENSFIAMSDIEAPYHLEEYLNRILELGKAQNVRTLIMAGDMLDVHTPGLKFWADMYQDQYGCTQEEAVDIFRKIILEMLGHFYDIYMISGNHDNRIPIATGGGLHLGMLLADIPKDRFHFSRKARMVVNTSRGPVIIYHQKSYRKNPITLAKELHHNSVIKGHTVITHTHIEQTGWSEDAQWQMIGLGCGRDQDVTPYLQFQETTFPKWNHSFLLCKDGYLNVMNLKSTNWRLYGCSA